MLPALPETMKAPVPTGPNESDSRAGHPGGSLSAAEIVALLYFDVMRIDPTRPAWEDRDRFVLLGEHRPTLMKRVGIGDSLGESAYDDDLLEKYGRTPWGIARGLQAAHRLSRRLRCPLSGRRPGRSCNDLAQWPW